MQTDRLPPPVPRRLPGREALLVVAGFTLVFGWLYLRPIVEGTFLSESDLYEYYLPIFLSPITIWSRFEFGGLPAFADPGDFTAYPLHFLFARLVGSWTALSVSAFVLAASFTYAYVRALTGSVRAAIVAGLAYGVSEALMERLPHSGTLHAAAWLPLIVLAMDRLRAEHTRRWIAIGAVAVACCFLAGHPQPAIYIYYCAGLYAVVGAVVSRAPLRYYLRVAAVFVLGGLLTFIKALPFVEASFYMARQEVNFGQFSGHGNSPAQMLSLLFPTILHEGREAPTYVGLVTVALAVAGAIETWRRGWRAPFWVAIAVVALLIGMGDATPVASLAYWIPLYWKFRVAARHLILAAFALCVLAGLAVAAIGRDAMRRRTVFIAAGVLAAAMAAGAAVLAAVPGAFAFEQRQPLPWTPGLWNGGVWVQLAIAAVTVAVVVAAARVGRRAWWTAAVAALLFADTLYSLPYGVTATGLVPITIPASSARPSVHATRIAATLADRQQRLLAPGGTHRDPVVPAAWARLWQIPIAGGYGPMLLQRQSTLAQMGTNGSVSWSSLAADDVSLDLLAVGRIVMRGDDLEAPGTFERAGVRWSEPALELTAGRADCNHPYPRELVIPLPPDTTVAEVALVGHLRCDEDLPHGTAVADISLEAAGVPVFTTTWHAGVEIADRALAEPSVLARAAHKPTERFDDPDQPENEYLMRIRPSGPVRADQLVIRVPPMPGWVAVDRVTLVDPAGAMRPLSPIDVVLGDPRRWTRESTFATSRVTDRGADDAGDGETPITVFENRRGRPRAWIASTVQTLSTGDLVAAIRYGQLPDGRRYDPGTVALLEGDTPTLRTFPDGPRRATISGAGDGTFDVDVDSPGGVLVLSEAHYPGWRARVDGSAVPLERVNLNLQGVVIPAGQHHVTFEFVSTTLRVGMAVSALALLLCVGLLVAPRRAGAAGGGPAA